MIFLNPTILFGLLAASIPVLIHMLNLRKLKKVEFSTLSFLKELQKTKIRRIKFKQWLLLALRVLIIIFLVASFARPALKTSAIGLASSAKTSAVLILDNSYSMSLVSGNGSNFNKAKESIKELLDEFEDGDEISVILTSPFKDKANNFTTNFFEAAERIDETEIGMIRNNLSSSIETAINLLGESGNFNKEIYLFSDLQKNSFEELPEKVPSSANIKFYIIDFSIDGNDNIAAAEFEFENQIFEMGREINFSGEVFNSSKESDNSFVSLFVNGSRSAQSGFNVESFESAEVELEFNLSNAGLNEFILELEDDDINYDNKRYLSLNVREKFGVLLISNSRDDMKFVEAALSTSPNISTRTINFNQLSSVDPNKFDVIIITGG